MARHYPKRTAVRVDQNEVAWGVTPSYNGSWLQVAQTNNEIIRQSSKADWQSETGISDLGTGRNLRHCYSQRPAINRTGEYMINNMEYQKGILSNVGGNVVRNCGSYLMFPRWCNSLDYEVYGPDLSSNKKLLRMNVLTDAVTTIFDQNTVPGFGSYDKLSLGESQGQGDLYDDRFALSIKRGSDLVVVVWSAANNSIVSQKTFSGAWSVTDNVELSNLGNYVVIGSTTADYAVYDASNMQYLHDAGPSGHGVMALDSDGVTECWISLTFDTVYRTIRKVVLSTGTDTIVLGDGTSQFSNNYVADYESLTGHLGFAPKRPGYVIWSNNDAQGPHTVAWLSLDGSKQIEWMCDHRSDDIGDYYAEPQASSNFDGSVVVFASNKRVSGGEINSYCVRTISTKCPDITTTGFTVAQDAANGTVVGQLAAIYNGVPITSDWRLHNSVNTAYAVSDSGVITVADSSQISSAGDPTIDVIVEGADGQTAEYVTIVVGQANSPPVLTQPNDIFVNAGDSGNFQLVGVDADNEPLNYVISGASPAWITCSSAGLVEYHPSLTASGYVVVGFAATDGQDISNIVYVSFNVAAQNQFSLNVDISGGQQSFATGKTITHIGQRTISGTGVAQPQNFGHFIDTGQSYRDGKVVRYQNTRTAMAGWNSAHPSIKGYLHRIDWDHYEPNSGQFNGAEVAQLEQLMTDCDTAGKGFMVYLKDVAFSTSDLSKTPIPADLRNNGYAVQSGPNSNPAVLSKLWDSVCMDRFIACCIDIHNRYKHHASFMGIMIPETTRSEWVNNGTTKVSHDAAMLTQYKRCVTNVKSVMQDRYLNVQINFLGGSPESETRIQELLDHMETVGGCMIGTPDSLHDQYEENPSHGNELVRAYGLFHGMKSKIPMGLSVETRDMPTTPDSTWTLFYDMGNDSLDPQFVFWYLYHDDSSIGNAWAPLVFNLLDNESWYVDTTIPSGSNYGGAGGSIVGANPSKVTAEYNGQALLITPNYTALTTDTDLFTVVFADDSGADVEYTVTFWDSDPGSLGDDTGTITSYKSFRHVADINNVVSQGVPNWVSSQIYTGYSGNYHLISANGSNIQGDTDCDYYPLDLAAILPAAGSYHLYIKMAAADASSDSAWAQVGGEIMVQDQPIYDKNGAFQYQAFRYTTDVTQERLVSASDGVIKWFPREINAGLDSFVFVEAAETELPTGSLGFVSYEWPGDTVITPPENKVVVIGQGVVMQFDLDLDANIGAFGVSYSIEDAAGNASLNLTAGNQEFVTTDSAENQHTYSFGVTGAAAGDCIVKISFTDGLGNYLESQSTVTVIDPATIVWPQGTTASIPAAKTIVQGGVFTIDADPQNIGSVALEPNRWSISNTNLTINGSTDSVGEFMASKIGECEITYTMQRTSDSSDPVTYTTLVTIVSPQTINPDDYIIKNNTAAVPLDVLSNDIQTRITTFTQPSSGFVYANADKTELYYNSVDGFIGQVTFNYAADDGSGGNIAGATVTLNVVDPASFEGSVQVTVGVDRYATRGSSIPFELIVLDNPENYAMSYHWTHGFGAAASFQNGVIDQETAVLNITFDNMSITDILGNVQCEVSQA